MNQNTFFSMILTLMVTLSSVAFASGTALTGPQTVPPGAVIQTAEGLDITIDGKIITSMAQVHQIFAQALHFPKWYGNNLDALEELLQDPMYVRQPLQISIVNGTALHSALQPEDSSELNPADSLIDILSYVAQQQKSATDLPKISFTYSR